jgi:hypothetical protein
MDDARWLVRILIWIIKAFAVSSCILIATQLSDDTAFCSTFKRVMDWLISDGSFLLLMGFCRNGSNFYFQREEENFVFSRESFL